MSRGYFDFVAQHPAYREVPKVWYITLSHSDCFWYDLVVNPVFANNAKEPIAIYLAELKKRVEESLEKRFIYFFASRPRVRFDTSRPPRYELFSGRLILHLLVGRDRKVRTVKEKLLDAETGKQIKPSVQLNDKFIRFYYSPNHSYIYSIHDFLRTARINLGIATHIHYIGITKNPESRPLNRQHRGLADTLYNVSTDEHDFFLFVNLFKITTQTNFSKYGIRYIVPNAMTDEVPVGAEGSIIERSFIAYFDSPIQKEERSHERASLEKELCSIRSQYNIDSVTVDFELENRDEYYRLCSDSVAAADRHVFSYAITDKGLSLTRLDADFNVAKHFFGKDVLGS